MNSRTIEAGPIGFQPFNPLHRLKEIFPPIINLEDNHSLEDRMIAGYDTLSREQKREAVRDGMAYFEIITELGGQVPVISKNIIYKDGVPISQEEITVVTDSLQTAAELGIPIHRKIERKLGVTDSDDDEGVERIEDRLNTLEEAVLFLNSLKRRVPAALDPIPSRVSHPSAQLKKEGLIALSILAAPSVEKSVRDAAMKLMQDHDKYALELYRSNLDVFREEETHSLYGQYL